LALTRRGKEEVVQGLHKRFQGSSSVILTKFARMTVAQATELRRMMRDVGGEFKVSKNTLFRLAAKDTQVEVIADRFVGQNAVVIAYEDSVAVAKALLEFIKQNAVLTVEGGVLNGKSMAAEDIEALSRLPSREVLLAQLLSVMLGCHRGLVQVLSGVPRKFLYALEAISDKKRTEE